MNRILINGTAYPCPIDFRMNKTENLVAEVKTMSGKSIYDVNGYKYDDITLKWNWVENSKLQSLLSATASGAFTFTFKDATTGTEKTINAIRKSSGCTETASVDPSGNLVWYGIEIALSFPDCYQN